MTRMVRITIAVGIVVLQAATLMARPRPRVVTVDCDRRGSIRSALEAATTPVTIEFRGTCNESVVIADDDVTLRGIIGANAAIVAAGSKGIEVIGAHRVTLENFRVTNTEGIGIHVRDGSHVMFDSIEVSGNALSGLLLEASSARLWNSTFSDNGVDGISAWNQSMVTLLGNIEASRNGRAGILLSTAALTNDYRYFHGARIDGNRMGIALQFGANVFIQTAAATIELDGNRDDTVSLYDGCSFIGPLTIRGSSAGLWVRNSVFQSNSMRVNGAGIGVYGDLGSSLTLGGLDITGNDSGIILYAAKLQLFDGSLTGNPSGDLTIRFGSHVDIFDLIPGTVACDGSVHTLGGVTCPSTARTTRTLSKNAVSQEQRAPRTPLPMFE